MPLELQAAIVAIVLGLLLLWDWHDTNKRRPL